MNLLKIFFLISFTIFVIANENNQTNDLNKSNDIPIVIGIINKNIKNNEFLDWKIIVGNPDTHMMEIEGNFKIIDILGNIIYETNAKFSIPPRKVRTYRTHSLIENVSKDTKAYIQSDIRGVICKSNFFLIHK